MILYLPGLVYGLVLILAASRDLQAKVDRPLTALLSLGLTQIEPLWQAVEVVIERLNPFEQPGFDRRNPVHRVAGLLLIAQMIWLTWRVVSKSGDAASQFFAAELGGLLLTMAASVVIYVSLSALGTGWRIRRDWREVLQRLGLKPPTPRDCLVGLASGFLIFVGVTIATLIVLYALSADQITAQMDGSRPLFELVKGSLPAALLVAVLAGTGEEILFRGALQPVFGLSATALVFTMAHAQYGLSPATLILFFVSLSLGLVRKRYSTTAAIIAHATYNFAPFLLYRLLPA